MVTFLSASDLMTIRREDPGGRPVLQVQMPLCNPSSVDGGPEIERLVQVNSPPHNPMTTPAFIVRYALLFSLNILYSIIQ